MLLWPPPGLLIVNARLIVFDSRLRGRDPADRYRYIVHVVYVRWSGAHDCVVVLLELVRGPVLRGLPRLREHISLLLACGDAAVVLRHF